MRWESLSHASNRLVLLGELKSTTPVVYGAMVRAGCYLIYSVPSDILRSIFSPNVTGSNADRARTGKQV